MLTVSDIDACDLIYLWSISEPRENSLRLEIAESTSAERPENARLFEVTWPIYLTYQVALERASSGSGAYDIKTGRLFVHYTKSRYMDYLETSSGIRTKPFEDFEQSGPLQHWGIYCLNHTIDVVAPMEPKIALLEPPWDNAYEVRQRFEEQLAKNRQESIEQTERDRLKKL